MIFWKLYCVKTLDPPLTDNFRILAPVNCTICSSNTDRWWWLTKTISTCHKFNTLLWLMIQFLSNPVWHFWFQTVHEQIWFNKHAKPGKSDMIIVGRSDFSSGNQNFTEYFSEQISEFCGAWSYLNLYSSAHMSSTVMEMQQQKVYLLWAD